MSYKHKNTKIRIILTIIGFVIVVIMLGIAVYLGYLYNKTETAIHRIAATDQYGDLSTEKNVSVKPMLFLLAGLDSRDGGDGVMNTDVLMLISFDPETRSSSFLSIPRDLLLKPESLPSRKANYYYAYYYIKDQSEVIPNTKDFFSNLLSLPIDHMVVVNFDMLRQTVDLLGGLTIDVDMDMKYNDTSDGTHIDLKKGLQKLDGQQVLDFVRYRKSNQGTGESSDFQRNERQQQVIKLILDKLSDFKSISQWGKVLDIIGENVKSDIPVSDLQQWLFNFSKIKPEQINSLNVESLWKSPYVYVNKEDLEQALTSLRDEAGISSKSQFHLESIGTID